MRITKRIIRQVTSKLANLTPNVFYYSSATQVIINNSLMKIVGKKNNDASFEAVMALPLITGSQKLLNKGDILEVKLTGVKDGGKDIGSFKVTIERLEGQP